MKTLLSRSPLRSDGAALRISLFIFAAALLVIGFPHPAAAQITLGDMFCNAQTEMEDFGDLFGGIAWIAGAFFIGTGLIKMKENADGQERVHRGLTRIGGGAALLALPFVAASIIQTIFLQQGGGGLAACNVGAVQVGNNLTGLDVLLNNLIGNIKNPLAYLVSCSAIIIGIFLIIKGLVKASKYGTDPQEHNMPKILSNLIVGAVLMVVGQTFTGFLTTLFGNAGVLASNNAVPNWAFIQQLNASQQFINAVESAGLFMELVGMIAFVRGWLLIKSAAEGTGRGTMAQGLTHMLGGVLAMNIFSFLELMDATFGTGFL